MSEFLIAAIRGRSDGDWRGSDHYQKLEIGGDVSNTITGVLKDNFIIEIMATKETKEKKQIELPKELQGKKFRIRKLTPRECFRLMDVDDSDIDKIQASGLSNSAQYKLAGNSIVVNVLAEIFRKMFIDTSNEEQQLSLW